MLFLYFRFLKQQAFQNPGTNNSFCYLPHQYLRNALNGLVPVWLREQLIDGGSIEQLTPSNISHLLSIVVYSFRFPSRKWATGQVVNLSGRGGLMLGGRSNTAKQSSCFFLSSALYPSCLPLPENLQVSSTGR